MRKIKRLVDQINEELEGAKDYAEKYVEAKVKGDATWANRYKEMAQDELKHAMYLHESVTALIAEVSKAVTPPPEMMEKWNAEHVLYVDHAAWIKQMLQL